MFIYRNKTTGAVITVPCHVSGDWELVEEPKKEDAKPAPKPKRTTKKK